MVKKPFLNLNDGISLRLIRAAVVIQGATEISLDELQFGQTISVSGVTRVDFTTTVEFSGIPMKMCLRMGRQDLLARLVLRILNGVA